MLRGEGLLKSLISLRNQQEFHEHCVERILKAMLSRCRVGQLLVAARYTRRGGIEINPWKSHRKFSSELQFSPS
ncbi:hypothetical protein [Legionella jordanis]|uniref:hypothetical protein n=1 Tax=Legionella jordanis TaxID=456 RepID=UPI00387DC937